MKSYEQIMYELTHCSTELAKLIEKMEATTEQMKAEREEMAR